MSDNEDVEYLFKKGHYYFFMDYFENAVAYLEKALELNPNHYKALDTIAMCYFRLSQKEFYDENNQENALNLAQKSKDFYLRAAENAPTPSEKESNLKMANIVIDEIK